MAETPLSYGALPQSDFTSRYNRVLEAAECGTQAELAEFFAVGRSGISSAIRRESVPSCWLMKLLEKKRINPDWIRSGTGAKYLVPADVEQSCPDVVYITEIRPPKECSAQELVNELVRRAMQNQDGGAIQKEVAASWMRVKK